MLLSASSAAMSEDECWDSSLPSLLHGLMSAECPMTAWMVFLCKSTVHSYQGSELVLNCMQPGQQAHFLNRKCYLIPLFTVAQMGIKKSWEQRCSRWGESSKASPSLQTSVPTGLSTQLQESLVGWGVQAMTYYFRGLPQWHLKVIS